MNNLLEEIFSSLEELYLGLDGALNMTDKMETLSSSIKLNRVPQSWGQYYPSKKPLLSWIRDLNLRHQ